MDRLDYPVFEFRILNSDIQEMARYIIDREITAQEMRTIEDSLERFFDFNQFQEVIVALLKDMM